MKTPTYSLDRWFDQVYEPAEDTFLLLDVLESDVQRIRALQPSVCLEIGCGSGVVSAFLSANLLNTSAVVFCTDVNPSALACTQHTAKLNCCEYHVLPVRMDLTKAFHPRLHNQIDLIVCNPPYVPTASVPKAAVNCDEGNDAAADLELSWSGGVNGRQVIDRLMPQVAELLSPSGQFYLLVVHENQVEQLRAWACEQFGLQSALAMKRQCRNELQYVVRFFRRTRTSQL